MSYFEKQLLEIRTGFVQLDDVNWIQNLQRASEMTSQALQANKKILFAGNGGSAADAQHMAGEFVSRFEFDRPGLPGLALTVDTSILTACANDYGYETVFSRQIQALGNSGDLFWGYTTSGKSQNIICAAEAAKQKGMQVIIFCGNYTEKFEGIADLIISINSNRTPRIQEWHLISGHIVCGTVESIIFS